MHVKTKRQLYMCRTKLNFKISTVVYMLISRIHQIAYIRLVIIIVHVSFPPTDMYCTSGKSLCKSPACPQRRTKRTADRAIIILYYDFVDLYDVWLTCLMKAPLVADAIIVRKCMPVHVLRDQFFISIQTSGSIITEKNILNILSSVIAEFSFITSSFVNNY